MRADGFLVEAGFQESIGDCFGVCALPLSELLAAAVSLTLGDTGGVTPDPGIAEPGLVVTDIGPAPGPGLANFSGREIPDAGVWGSRGRGGRERGEGEGRYAAWGRPEWNLASAAGGVKESLMEMGMPGPPDSLLSP